MSQYTIIDDIFIGTQKRSRKPSTQSILGVSNSHDKTHKRFYSKQFIPYTTQRDIKGKLIKNTYQNDNTKKQSALWCLSKDIQNHQISTKNIMQKTLIDMRFKLNQVSHFRNVQSKSHLSKFPKFKKDVQMLENKDYQKKYKKAKIQQHQWMTNLQSKFGFSKMLNEEIQKQEESDHQNFMLTAQSVNLKKGRPNKSLQIKTKQKNKKNKQEKTQLKSYKSLLNIKSHRNPELMEIQRHVKVHFKHPQLDRLKQSRKLGFKFVDNLQQGDKKFKQKIEQYRTIKQRIKKQMAKF